MLVWVVSTGGTSAPNNLRTSADKCLGKIIPSSKFCLTEFKNSLWVICCVSLFDIKSVRDSVIKLPETDDKDGAL